MRSMIAENAEREKERERERERVRDRKRENHSRFVCKKKKFSRGAKSRAETSHFRNELVLLERALLNVLWVKVHKTSP